MAEITPNPPCGEPMDSARERALVGIIAAGAAVNLLLLLFKFAAGVGGHSGAMMADAVHSLSDFATDLIVFLCLRLSALTFDCNLSRLIAAYHVHHRHRAALRRYRYLLGGRS